MCVCGPVDAETTVATYLSPSKPMPFFRKKVASSLSRDEARS